MIVAGALFYRHSDAIFGHSLGAGVSTRAGRAVLPPNVSEGCPG